jgi:hypothetical protein
VFNKIGKSGQQIIIVVHVDDLMVTSKSQDDPDTFGLDLKHVNPQTRAPKWIFVRTFHSTVEFNENRKNPKIQI